jgi:hypothetical protein
MTSRINQDCVENLFSRIRGSGYDHPSPLSSLQRLRSIIISANPSALFVNTNTEDYDDSEFLVSDVLKRAKVPLTIDVSADDSVESENSNDDSVNFRASLLVNNNDDADDEDDEYNVNDPTPVIDEPSASESDLEPSHVNETTMHTMRQSQEDNAFEYLLGYLAKKLHTLFPELGDYTYKSASDHNYLPLSSAPPSWVHFLSYGGLMAPSPDFVTKASELEVLFLREVGQSGVPRGKNIVKRLTTKFSEASTLDPVIVRAFVRQRVFIRMKYEAQKLNSVAIEKKLKELVKLKKTAVFYNNHASLLPRVVPPNAIDVRGIHVMPAKPLPKVSTYATRMSRLSR